MLISHPCLRFSGIPWVLTFCDQHSRMPGLCPRAWHSQDGRGVIIGWGKERRDLTLVDDTAPGTGSGGLDDRTWQEGTLKTRDGWI